MDKIQALDRFWNSFGLPAYDESTVPQNAPLPRITYEAATDSFDSELYLTASLWYRSSSWKEISQKAEAISRYIVQMNPPTIQLDDGRLYITKGTPFAQRMTDPDDSIRRIYLNIKVEYLTAF